MQTDVTRVRTSEEENLNAISATAPPAFPKTYKLRAVAKLAIMLTLETLYLHCEVHPGQL